MRFSSLSLVRSAVPRSSWIRRHLPFALFLVGLGSLVLAMARPAAIVPVPSSQTTVVLAMDVSRSMCATDIPPNRLVAAEEAAASFVERQRGGTQIGIVAFAGFAEMVQAPTDDEEVLLDVIASLATGRRTAIGSAILESIDAIAEIDPSVARSVDVGRPDRQRPTGGPRGRLCAGHHRAAHRWREQRRAGPGRGRPAGRRPRHPRLHDRVRDGGSGRSAPACGAQQVGREPGDNGQGFSDPGFGGGGFGGTGGGRRRAIDEETLTAVAEATGGEYYPAESAEQLLEVFEQLPTDLITSHEVVEISVAFTAHRGVADRRRHRARPGLAAAAVALC